MKSDELESALAICVASVPNSLNFNDVNRVLYGVKDSIVAYSNSIFVTGIR